MKELESRGDPPAQLWLWCSLPNVTVISLDIMKWKCKDINSLYTSSYPFISFMHATTLHFILLPTLVQFLCKLNILAHI